MEVILREDVPTLGRAGEVVKVKDGFARNFLFPHRKAVAVTPGALKALGEQRAHLEAKRERLRKEAEELAGRLAAQPVVLEKQAGEEDRLFGQVTPAEIAKGLAALGFSVDRRLIRLKDPIRKIGTHTAEIHLHADVVAAVTVEVRKK